MNAIEISGLCKHFGDFTLGPFSLSLPSGSILGLVGENGAGKSTTIKLIMDALTRDVGSITVLGTDNRSPQFRRTKEEIGVVLDEAYFPEVITAVQVNSILKHTYSNWDEEAFGDYLHRFDLPRQKAFREFSRGMKRKLAIAAALSHHPKLLLLDEATSGLDPMIRDEILDLFNDFTRQEDHSILLSSHIVSDLEKICDYIAFLHRGQLLFCQEKDRLLEEYAVAKLPPDLLEAVPPEAILGRKETAYGADLLVNREKLSAAIPLERTNLEDIILFLAKEGTHR